MGRLKRFLTKRVPTLHHTVLVESGAREILEKLLPELYKHSPRIDIVTCYAGPPVNFRPECGRIYDIADYQGAEARNRLYAELWDQHYSAIGIICADQPIMTKWKWALTAHIQSKLFIINENVDLFWVDRGNWRIILHFILFRAGLSGADAVRTLTQLAAFPFTVLFLLGWAALAHARRRVRALG